MSTNSMTTGPRAAVSVSALDLAVEDLESLDAPSVLEWAAGFAAGVAVGVAVGLLAT